MRAAGLFLPAAAGASSPEEAVRAYCLANGHQLVGLFTAGPSETPEDAYQQMVAALKVRPALVVVPDSTHFAPDLEAAAARLLELRALGCEIQCADARLPDLVLNALDRLGLQGRWPSRQRRIRQAIMSKASRGEVLGRTPYGYLAGLDGLLTPAQAEAEVVRSIFAWYAGRRAAALAPVVATAPPPAASAATPAQDGIGLRLIAQRLNGQGVRTRQGLPWTPLTVRNVLRNRTYLGLYSRYGVWISGAHPPIVERALFNRAQAILDKRKPRQAVDKAAGEPFLLSGLLRCGVCGRGVFGLTRRRSWARKDGTKRSVVYRYYECSFRPPARSRSGDAGDHPSWRAEDLEQAVRAAVAGMAPAAGPAAPAPGPEALEGPLPRPASRGRPKAVVSAERDFMRTLRNVAAGRARSDDLAAALERLRAVSAASASGSGQNPPDGQAVRPASQSSSERDRIAAAVAHIVVHDGRVEAVPRRAASAP